MRSPAAPSGPVVALLVSTGLAAAGVVNLALATPGLATTAYVSDDLVLGVYAEKDPQSMRLATLHSGALLDVLATDGDFTQVRLGDGKTGWVRSSFLVTHEPATVRVKELEDEINRARAATPELAAAGTSNEIEQLKADLAAAQTELRDARTATQAAQPGLSLAAGRFTLTKAAIGLWPLGLAAICVSVGLGFLLGYRFLARRVRQQFGGIKVY